MARANDGHSNHVRDTCQSRADCSTLIKAQLSALNMATERGTSDKMEATRFSQCVHDQRRRLEAEDCNSIQCAQLFSRGRRRIRPPHCLAHARPTMCCSTSRALPQKLSLAKNTSYRNIGPAKSISKARGCLVLQQKQDLKGAYIGGGGGALICAIRMCNACSIGAQYNAHLLLRRVLTLNPLGFLTDLVAEA